MLLEYNEDVIRSKIEYKVKKKNKKTRNLINVFYPFRIQNYKNEHVIRLVKRCKKP